MVCFMYMRDTYGLIRFCIGVANFVVLQWFGVRLHRAEDHGRVWVLARRSLRSGEMITTDDIDLCSARLVYAWSLLRWVWPLTGWLSGYLWISNRSSREFGHVR
jgi:hypothetical protein